MSLVGKFIFRMTEEFHQLGEIVEQITPEVYLIKWDRMSDDGHNAQALFLVPLEEMLTRAEDGTAEWEFYASRAELDALHDWLCTVDESAETKLPSDQKLN